MSTQALALRTDSIMPEDSVVVDTLADATESLDPLPVRLQKLLDNDIFERTQVAFMYTILRPIALCSRIMSVSVCVLPPTKNS